MRVEKDCACYRERLGARVRARASWLRNNYRNTYMNDWSRALERARETVRPGRYTYELSKYVQLQTLYP